MFSLPVSPPPASIMIIDAGVCGPRSENAGWPPEGGTQLMRRQWQQSGRS